MTLRYWYSTRAWTVQVNVDIGDIVIWTAPILRRFVGQPRDAIRRWCVAKGWPLTITPLPWPPSPDPDAIVCEFCLRDPACCDCDTEGGGAASHYVRYGDAITQRRRPLAVAGSADERGANRESLPGVQRADLA